jgi:hypothetical protein
MKDIVILAPSRSGHNWTARFIRSWFPEKGKVKVHQFEAVEPSLWDARVRHRIYRGLVVDNSHEVIAVVQVRDFLNFAASWTKYMIRRGNAYKEKGVTKLYEIWYNIAREALNETSYIRNNKYVLMYDLFVQNEEYRRSLCSILDGEYTETVKDLVPDGGLGSTFDSFNFQGNGSQMKVLDRWEWFNTEEGEYYKRLLKSFPEILKYYQSNFDLTPGQSKLVSELLT